MKVAFQDLKGPYLARKAELDAAVARVLDSGWYIGGPECKAFEQAFAAASGQAHAIGVANGTEAIALMLRASGVGDGDEVLVPAVSAYPTTVGVVQAGAVPIYVDVHPEDGLMDLARIEEAISQKTKAILPVHLYGKPCDMAGLKAIAQKRGLVLASDCAQAHGAGFQGKPIGTWALASAWSFYPTKNLGAFGDGGAVTTSDAALAEKVRRMGNYGQRNRYEHEEWGINSRLDPLQAAVLVIKLADLGKENDKRRQVAQKYLATLQGLEGLQVSPPRKDTESSWHLFPVLLKDEATRGRVQEKLAQKGVETLIHYPIAMPYQRATKAAWLGGRDFPVARNFCSRVLSLPLHPGLADDQIQYVVDSLKACLRD